MTSLREFEADLHMHSCLSPCADLYMTPMRMAQRARSEGLDMMALCDHNSAENVIFGMRACARLGGPVFFPGLEISSTEEVHVVGIFCEVEKALMMQRTVYRRLPADVHNSDLFGEQIIVNENDEVEGFSEKMLIGSVDMDLKSVVDHIHELDGIAIAAHIDREAFGVVGQLGFIPDDVEFDAVELSGPAAAAAAGGEGRGEMGKKYPGSEKFPVLFSSDAHRLDEIGARTTRFLLKEPGLDEIRMALKEIGGRRVAGGIK